MKRRDLIRHLEAHGCEKLREGGDHTMYVNRSARKVSAVPRQYTHVKSVWVDLSGRPMGWYGK